MKFILGICLLLLVSCASGVRKEIEQDKSKLREPVDKEAMVAKAHNLFLNSPHYSQEQKLALQNLMSQTRIKSQALSESLYKAKLVLFQELFSTTSGYQQSARQTAKIEELERQLRKINQRKMDLMIESLHESRKILGLSDEETLRQHYEFFLDNFKLTGN